MSAFTFELSGVEGVQAKLTELGAQAQPRLAAALYQEAEGIMTAAKLQTPVETGVLRDSGHVEPPVMAQGEVSVTMGFGGAADAYALVQHERLDFHHTVGNAKYLERPFLEKVQGLPERVGVKVLGEAA